MPAFKDKGNSTWFVKCYYDTWDGQRKQKLKRGFATKKEAQEWERNFLLEETADLDMTFASFVELYQRDKYIDLKQNTIETKNNIINKKILPYFGSKKISHISASDIKQWQNTMRTMTDKTGQRFSPTYLKTINNQLSSIFNHAVKLYDLKANPLHKTGSMGKKKAKEMSFWNKEEYTTFATAMMDKPLSYCAFELLYWCGIRSGELLALAKQDFCFETGLLTINKTYNRLNREDMITEPKTEKSNRTIKLPASLLEIVKEYVGGLYGLHDSDRLFPVTKNYLHHEMDRGTKATGVKRIRIHDLRHSHVSLLIDMGFTAVAIADRLGHESIDITLNYAHMFPSKQTEMADKLEDLRNGD